ncbi:MAG: DUF2780 domain-containing protein [Candidatus Sericytochromatia bacterium]
MSLVSSLCADIPELSLYQAEQAAGLMLRLLYAELESQDQAQFLTLVPEASDLMHRVPPPQHWGPLNLQEGLSVKLGASRLQALGRLKPLAQAFDALDLSAEQMLALGPSLGQQLIAAGAQPFKREISRVLGGFVFR